MCDLLAYRLVLGGKTGVCDPCQGDHDMAHKHKRNHPDWHPDQRVGDQGYPLWLPPDIRQQRRVLAEVRRRKQADEAAGRDPVEPIFLPGLPWPV